MANTTIGGLTIKDYGSPVPASEVEARTELEAKYGKVWTTDEMRKEFDIVGFGAPFVVAVEKSTGAKGSLEFSHSPRFYFDWRAK